MTTADNWLAVQCCIDDDDEDDDDVLFFTNYKSSVLVTRLNLD